MTRSSVFLTTFPKLAEPPSLKATAGYRGPDFRSSLLNAILWNVPFIENPISPLVTFKKTPIL